MQRSQLIFKDTEFYVIASTHPQSPLPRLYNFENIIFKLKDSFGITVIDNPENYEYPTTRDASGNNPVYVGRIRKNLALNNGITLWCVADNLRIGAALNTVRICQKVIEMDLY